MNERKKNGGRRQAGGGSPSAKYLAQYKQWLAGLNRGERIRYRILQTATIISAIIIVAFLILQAWIRVPDVPGFPGSGQSGMDGALQGITFDGAELPEVAKSGRKPGYYTFLVAGRDVASGATDTMLLFTFDSVGKKLEAISLPRDTMINTKATSKRLNTVYARNRGSSDLSEKERITQGMSALKQEVSKLTGIYPDYYVLVEWEAIGELVNAVGGVEFEVPFLMDYKDPYQDLYIYQEPGLRVLNGDDAMQVIRWRKNNGSGSSLAVGDTGRMEIQQNFLKAVLKECMDPATLLKIPTLAKVFLDNVNTDLTSGNILAFAQLTIGMDLQNGIRFSTIPYYGVSYKRASMVVPIQDELLTLVNGGLNPYQDEIRASDLQLIYQNSDGSFGVTNATLADEAMGRPVVKVEAPVEEDPEVSVDPDTPADPEQPLPGDGTGETTDPETPEEPLPPDGSQQPGEGGQEGGASSEEQTPDPDIGSIGDIDPDQVLPDPGSSAAAPGETETVPVPAAPSAQSGQGTEQAA